MLRPRHRGTKNRKTDQTPEFRPKPFLRKEEVDKCLRADGRNKEVASQTAGPSCTKGSLLFVRRTSKPGVANAKSVEALETPPCCVGGTVVVEVNKSGAVAPAIMQARRPAKYTPAKRVRPAHLATKLLCRYWYLPVLPSPSLPLSMARCVAQCLLSKYQLFALYEKSATLYVRSAALKAQ